MKVVEYGSTCTDTIIFQTKHNVNTEIFNTTSMNRAYINAREISKVKYDDLQTLLAHVPEKYHEYYRALKHSQKTLNNDYAMVTRQSSDDDE